MQDLVLHILHGLLSSDAMLSGNLVIGGSTVHNIADEKTWSSRILAGEQFKDHWWEILVICEQTKDPRGSLRDVALEILDLNESVTALFCRVLEYYQSAVQVLAVSAIYTINTKKCCWSPNELIQILISCSCLTTQRFESNTQTIIQFQTSNHGCTLDIIEVTWKIHMTLKELT
jgi:hypothetical protein